MILFLNIQDDLNTLIKYEKKKYYNTCFSISFIYILSTDKLWSLLLIAVIFKWKKGIYIKLLQTLIMIFEIR